MKKFKSILSQLSAFSFFSALLAAIALCFFILSFPLTLDSAIAAEKKAPTVPIKIPKGIASAARKDRAPKPPVRTADAELEESPVDTVLVLDASRSMYRTDPDRIRDKAAKLFIRMLGRRDRVAAIAFDGEARTVFPLTDINSDTLQAIDYSLDNMATEGAWTDMQVALSAAYKLLAEEGRTDAKKCIILFSDGKFDPNPARGTVMDLISELHEKELPLFKQSQMALYALSLSDLADQEFLEHIAKMTNGKHWHAEDATKISIQFSNLLLELKKPEILNDNEDGLRVTEGTGSATFIVRKPNSSINVELYNPRGASFTILDTREGVSWITAETFDLVTITNPQPGLWAVLGVDDVEENVTLLPDIKLAVELSNKNLHTEEPVELKAKLKSRGKTVVDKDLNSVMYFTFKAMGIGSDNKELAGLLKEKDSEPGVYSTELDFKHEGEIEIFVAASSRTFSLQEKLVTKISNEMLTLKVVEEVSESEGEASEAIEIRLSKSALALMNRSLEVKAKSAKKKKLKSLGFIPSRDEEAVFIAKTSPLAAGNYTITAKVTGLDRAGKEVTYSSEPLEYTSNNDKVEGDEHASGSGTWIFGLLFMFVAVGGTAGSAYIFSRQLNSKAILPEDLSVNEISEDTTKAIEEVASRASAERREPADSDRQLFAALPDAYPATEQSEPAVVDAVNEQNSAEVQAQVEAALAESSAAPQGESSEENNEKNLAQPEATENSSVEAPANSEDQVVSDVAEASKEAA